ncbi:hypothetical protein JZU51_03240 [bacterium]|nr:hypothetical protein [bacterium]
MVPVGGYDGSVGWGADHLDTFAGFQKAAILFYLLASHRIHDSFIVSFPQEQALNIVMEQAYREVTGYQPKIDSKTSIIMENKKRPVKDLLTEQTWKNPNLQLSEEFKQTYRSYCRINMEWKELTGKDNIFFYSRNRTYNRETYPD